MHTSKFAIEARSSRSDGSLAEKLILVGSKLCFGCENSNKSKSRNFKPIFVHTLRRSSHSSYKTKVVLISVKMSLFMLTAFINVTANTFITYLKLQINNMSLFNGKTDFDLASIKKAEH